MSGQLDESEPSTFVFEANKNQSKAKFSSDDRCFVVESTSGGLIFSPGWTLRHTTLMDENPSSASNADWFAHLTQEGKENNKLDHVDIYEGEFETDLYSAIRGMGRLRHLSELSADEVLRIDIDLFAGMMRKCSHLQEDEDEVRYDPKSFIEQISSMSDAERLSVGEEVAEVVAVENIYDFGNSIFVHIESMNFLQPLPDGYVVEHSKSSSSDHMDSFRGIPFFDLLERTNPEG